MDNKERIELIEIRTMAASVIEKIDKLIPTEEVPKKTKARLSLVAKNKILNRRKLIRLGHHVN